MSPGINLIETGTPMVESQKRELVADGGELVRIVSFATVEGSKIEII